MNKLWKRKVSWLRSRRFWTALVLAASLAFWAGGGLRVLAYSLYFLDGFTRIEQGSRLAPWLAYPVEETVARLELGPSSPALEVAVYRPTSLNRRLPALLLVPGFTKLGLRDPRMIGLARLLAGAGALVVLPGLEGLFHYRWGPELVPEMEASFDFLARQLDADPSRLGIFGISISGGFALAVAERPAIASRLSFAIAFAPFFEYDALSEFSLTGRYEEAGEARHRAPNPFSRWILLYNALPALLPPADPDFAALEETLRLKILEKPDEAARAEGRMSAGGRGLLRLLEAGSEEELRPRARQAIDFLRPLSQDLSPHRNLCALHGRLFILHGAEDDVIPYTESLKLARACEACSELRCELLVTGLYDHATLDSGRKGWWRSVTVELPAYLSYAGFVARVLRQLLP